MSDSPKFPPLEFCAMQYCKIGVVSCCDITTEIEFYPYMHNAMHANAYSKLTTLNVYSTNQSLDEGMIS